MLQRMLLGNKFVFWVALLTTLAMLPAFATPAEAGCLREWQGCGDCATKAFWRAVGRLSPSEAEDAWIDALDCDIDLFHCVAMAHHHTYVCAV